MCGSFFVLRCGWGNRAIGALPSAVLDFHRYHPTPSHQVMIRVVGPGNARLSHKSADFIWWYRLLKAPATFQPFIAALDHHYAHHDLHSFVFESYAPVYVPPAEANCPSEPRI